MSNLELAAVAAARHGDAELDEAIRDARSAADRIRHVVRDLKVFSRADEVSRGPVELARVIESSVRMAANEIRHRARLVMRLADVPAVDGNEARLGQVFLNLIVNAAHAIPEGRAEHNELRIATRATKDGVAVDVTDTGVGMTDDVVARLFTPFFTTKPVGDGTGLGLSICHRILEELGGRIEVRTAPGNGSTFTVHLPASTARAAASTASDATTELTVPIVRRAKVLVVDDEPMIGKALRRMLSPLHDVTVVTEGTDALTRYDAGERWDVILCDLMMPQMTGMDLHAAFVERDPSVADRMHFLTGGAFTARARNFLDGISNPHLDKPFDGPQVTALVANALERLEPV
jgi:CheY-like chemotaxis protein